MKNKKENIFNRIIENLKDFKIEILVIFLVVIDIIIIFLLPCYGIKDSGQKLTIFVSILTFAGVILLYKGITLQSRNLSEYKKEKAEHQLDNFIDKFLITKESIIKENKIDCLEDLKFLKPHNNTNEILANNKLHAWKTNYPERKYSDFIPMFSFLDLSIDVIKNNLNNNQQTRIYLNSFLTKNDKLFIALYSRCFIGDEAFINYQDSDIFRTISEKDFDKAFDPDFGESQNGKYLYELIFNIKKYPDLVNSLKFIY